MFTEKDENATLLAKIGNALSRIPEEKVEQIMVETTERQRSIMNFLLKRNKFEQENEKQ